MYGLPTLFKLNHPCTPRFVARDDDPMKGAVDAIERSHCTMWREMRMANNATSTGIPTQTRRESL
jgi:hypothetical protein